MSLLLKMMGVFVMSIFFPLVLNMIYLVLGMLTHQSLKLFLLLNLIIFVNVAPM